MIINNIFVGHHVLAQTGANTLEHVQVKGINKGKVIVKLSDGNIVEIEPQYIIKSFGYA